MNAIEREFVANQEANTNEPKDIAVDYDSEIRGWYCQNMKTGKSVVVPGCKWMSEQEVKDLADEYL